MLCYVVSPLSPRHGTHTHTQAADERVVAAQAEALGARKERDQARKAAAKEAMDR